MMNANEKTQAVKLVEDMVAHGYHLMQHPTAKAMVDCYEALPLNWWQETHDQFVAIRGAATPSSRPFGGPRAAEGCALGPNSRY